MKIQCENLIDNNLALLLNSNEFPLLNNRYLNDLEIVSIQALKMAQTDDILTKLQAYPKFRNIMPNDIINLRLLLHLKSTGEMLEMWCLKILRYIEIQYTQLKRKEITYGRPKEVRVTIFNQIMALFIEYFLCKNDFLYLNAALKIADLKWITPTNHTTISLKTLHYLKKYQMDAILKKMENGK